MISDEKLSVYLSLQKIVLTSTDSTNLLDILLQETVNRLNFIGFPINFVASVFLEEDKEYFMQSPTSTNAFIKTPENPTGQKSLYPRRKITKSMVVELPSNVLIKLQDISTLLETTTLLSEGDYALQLLRGQPLVLINPEALIKETYPKKAEIKTLFICPSYTADKQEVWFILATPKTHHDLTEDDLNFLRMVGSLLTFSLKLQDAENLKNSISQEVYKMNVKLHELDKLKDDFVSVASHELRTPMTAIRSYAWMALNRADVPLSDKMKRYLSRTLISTERLINLVNDMLNISRIESGRIEIVPKPFDILKLMDDVFGEISAKAAEKSLHVASLNTQVPLIFADADKVHQILLNLIGNAMKFTPVNGTVTISYFTDGLVVDVSVKDSGVGMLKEDLSRLFKKFGRLDNSYVAAATSGGTGLGLYICKNLVEMMKGKIWADSEGMGKGSTFSFSLPVATADNIAHANDYSTKVSEGDAKTLEPVAL